MENLSPRPPAPRAKAIALDRYRPLIESWLDEDERNWRKRRYESTPIPLTTLTPPLSGYLPQAWPSRIPLG